MIPSLGSRGLAACLDAVAALNPAPRAVVVVLSGGAESPSVPPDVDLVSTPRRMGFAEAVNAGISRVIDRVDLVGLLNDDAIPPSGWLGSLVDGLRNNPDAAAVQGTILDRDRRSVDGRGITMDPWALPVQLDRGVPGSTVGDENRPILAVSGTAALFRVRALREVSSGSARPFDPTFGSYHEDLDLGLRLHRIGWTARWVPASPVRHEGSDTGSRMRWRHPWWLLANRWRALAGNLTPSALLRLAPRLARGELRAINTLLRENPRTLPVAMAVGMAWPALVAQGWIRQTPGARLEALPEIR